MSQSDIEIPPQWKDIKNLKEYKPLQSTDNIKKYIENISNIEGADELKTQLVTYKQRLTNLIQIINPLLTDARTLIPKLDFERYLKTIFINPFIKGYKKKLDEASWNKERIKNSDIDGQEQEYIYVESDTNVDNFKKQLLILFSPFLTDTIGLFINPDNLNTNLEKENKNCTELIELAENFRTYVMEKKQKINILTSVDYNTAELVFIDKKNIKEEDYIERLTEDELKEEDKLSINHLNSLLSLIDTNIKSLDVVKEIETFDKDIIFKKGVNTSVLLKNILDLDDVVIIKGLEKKRNLPTKPNQKGGFDFPREYIISDETNVSLINLLKNLNKLQETFSTLIEDAEYLQQLQIRYNNYIHYVFSIIQRLLSKDKGDILEFYRYLDKFTIKKYIEKLNSIKSQINKDDDKMKYLNEYHYITIDKILSCLNFINTIFEENKLVDINFEENKLVDINFEENKLVDINNCKGSIKNDLYVFNNFKKIIDLI